MNEDQIIDAAEREMDLYRSEITRITGQRDKLHAAIGQLRGGITALAADLTASADATRPSRKSQIEDECAIALRKLLETPAQEGE